MKRDKIDSTQLGIAGEFYVLAQLLSRGLVATFTLGNTKGIDILVTNEKLNKLFKVEVKTTQKKPSKWTYEPDKHKYNWIMSQKHETIVDKNLIYCFVHIDKVDEIPSFYLVPSKDVAKYVKWQHEKWIEIGGSKNKSNKIRVFRIDTDDPEGYKDNWNLFD